MVARFSIQGIFTFVMIVGIVIGKLPRKISRMMTMAKKYSLCNIRMVQKWNIQHHNRQ